MKSHHKKWGAALGMTAALLSWSSSGYSQVFDTPASDFSLEALEPSGDGFLFPNLPLTLNAGNFDPSVIATGDIALNEVVVAGVSVLQLIDDVPSLVHRYWTIVHDSATDTRSLVQTAPSDIIVTSEFEPFYLLPDSLQLLDLNRDGSDDIGVLGSVIDERDAATPIASGFKLVKSGSFGAAGVFGVPSQSGPNFFETSLNLLGQQTGASIPSLLGGIGTQPSLATADFDGDGNADLAFYDFIVDEDPNIQVAVSLKNDGTFGTLPRTDSTLNLPVELQGEDFAYNLVAADVDGDGAPDLAITFDSFEGSGGVDILLVFKGNGDGSFVSDPIASATIGTDVQLLSLAAGNFDGNDFLDFAVGSAVGDDGPSSTQLNVVLCSPGSPAVCNVDVVAFSGLFIPISLASADLDEDGLDDLALSYLQCSGVDGCEIEGFSSGVSVHLNQGGSFNATPDQNLLLGGASDSRFTVQVVAKEIDGCGGPDLAYTGFVIPTPEPSATPVVITPVLANLKTLVSKQGGFETAGNYATVAFNHNDDPIADAGAAVQTDAGIQVGGDPTCAGELGETLNIQWEVISGSAQISDPTAANPIVTASQNAVLQVTCSDACGADSTSTVTVSNGFLLNGTGCSLGQSAQGGLTWLLGLFGLLPLAIRRRQS